MIHFQNKDEICDTLIFRNTCGLKNFLDDMNNARTKYVPISMKADCMITIRTKGFQKGERKSIPRDSFGQGDARKPLVLF